MKNLRKMTENLHDNMTKKEWAEYHKAVVMARKSTADSAESSPGKAASKVISKEAMKWFRDTELNHYGWKILDRWAESQPKKLRELEQESILEMTTRVFQQQFKEQEVLDDRYQPATAHLSAHEILEMNGIKMTL